jgi:XTP/dITP diphosphohydrolase
VTRDEKRIDYVTSSDYKIEEAKALENCTLEDGTRIESVCDFVIRREIIVETLEINLEAMVRAEVLRAYGEVRVPCIVEHAGLIFDGRANYPGGLTKPMWKELQDDFVSATQSKNQRATARAVVAYCDGQTKGTLVDPPRGGREFYWDRVFVPDDPTGRAAEKTYAEIVEDPTLGLAHKMQNLSQSAKAMRKFIEHRMQNPWTDLELWRLGAIDPAANARAVPRLVPKGAHRRSNFRCSNRQWRASAHVRTLRLRQVCWHRRRRAYLPVFHSDELARSLAPLYKQFELLEGDIFAVPRSLTRFEPQQERRIYGSDW